MADWVKLFNAEMNSWSADHDVIEFDQDVRTSSKQILKDIKNGTDLYMTYSKSATLSGIGQYQHWFVVAVVQTVDDRGDPCESKYYIEFGAITMNHNDARVTINNMRRDWTKDEQTPHKVMNNSIRQRIEHVLGMTNYSICLRNCEHVANYIFDGIWHSRQLNDTLSDLLLNPLMGDKIQLVNKFPSRIKPHVFLEDTNREQIYTFLTDDNAAQLFKPYSMQYFLEQGEEDNTYNILFIGPTGDGKSRLINVLFNQEIVESEASLNSVTTDIAMIRCKGKVYDNSTRQYVDKDIIITDTIGLADTKWGDGKNMTSLMNFLKSRISSNLRHFDLVYIVVKNGRVLKEIRKEIINVLEWLKYPNNVNRLRFLVSHSDYLNIEDKNRLKSQAIDIFDIEKNQQDFEPRDEHLIYFTSFPPERVDNEDKLSDNQKKYINKDLSKLYKNMQHSDNSNRIEITLSVNQNQGCTII